MNIRLLKMFVLTELLKKIFKETFRTKQRRLGTQKGGSRVVKRCKKFGDVCYGQSYQKFRIE